MSKSILIIILSFLAVTFVAAQDAFTPYQGTQHTYKVYNHEGSTYNWAVYTQLNPLVAANPAANTITGNGSSQISVLWNQTGIYYIIVTETDNTGCTNTKAIRISVIPNNFKVQFNNTISSACFQANNSFTVPLKFTDGETQPIPADNFPMLVSFQINGVAQSAQTITFTSQTLVIAGSAFTANPINDTPVVITIISATDKNNLTIQSETTSAQNIHSHTVFRNLIAPTVLPLITNDTTPIISGIAEISPNETLKVLVNGFTYTTGDGNLSLTGKNWILQIPANRNIAEGIYEVIATVSNNICSLNDLTLNELIIDTTPPAIPTVNMLVTNNNLPQIGGNAVLASGEILKITLNNIVYTVGDGNLTHSGNSWILKVPAGNSLSEGTYNVVASVTDAVGNISTDITTNELQIDTTVPAVPTVNLLSTNVKTPQITGTVNFITGDKFTVQINGITYTAGEGILTINGIVWTLNVPVANTLPDGTYNVVATHTNASGTSSVDVTTNEITIFSNRPPLVVNDVATTKTGLAVSGNVLTNDSDPEGGNLYLKINPVSGPANGTIAFKADGSYTYTPNTGFSGIDEITYEVCDDGTPQSCSQGKLSVTVEIIVIRRLAANDVNVTFINKPVSGNVLINDAGYFGFSPTASVYLTPMNGTLNLSANGDYTYTPKANFTGTDNFYYKVCTSVLPADCDTVNVTIHVITDELANIPPIANDDEVLITVNTSARGNILANDFSATGEQLLLNTKTKDGPKSGVLVLNSDGTFTYTPNNGFIGDDYFIYEVCGYVSGFCATARVTIKVSSDQNSSTLFAADDLFFLTGTTLQGNLLTNDTYPSVTTLNLKRTPVVNASNGSVVINSNGSFTYTPQKGFIGTDQFVYEICDTQLNSCVRATVIIIVKEAPSVFADLGIVKTGPATINPGQAINYQLTVNNYGTAAATKIEISDFLPSAVISPVFIVDGSTASRPWTGFYELANLDVNKTFNIFITGTVSQNAPDTLRNMAIVSSATWDPKPDNNVSIVKTVVTRGPMARITGAPYIAVGSCNTVGKVLDASKSSGTGLVYSWSPTAYLDNPTSSKPVFKPGATTRYKLTITDNIGRKDTSSILVLVPPAPKAVTDKNVFVESPNQTIMLNGSRSTGVGLSYLWITKEGILLNGKTIPTAQVSGLGMYYLQVTDSLGCAHRDSVNVGLYIQAINDTAKIKINESVVINVLKNDIPQKGINPSSLSIVTPPLHGIATVQADSLILYMPELSYVGQDEFVYAICDYFKNCDQAKVLVLINDVPLFIPDAFSPNGDGINDKFEIKGIYAYQSVQIEIFNRWGNLVYFSNNYGEGKGKDGYWDGVAKAGLRVGAGAVPTGTYFYVLKLNGKENINGSIYIDR